MSIYVFTNQSGFDVVLSITYEQFLAMLIGLMTWIFVVIALKVNLIVLNLFLRKIMLVYLIKLMIYFIVSWTTILLTMFYIFRHTLTGF
jgi:hypothetical protein